MAVTSRDLRTGRSHSEQQNRSLSGALERSLPSLPTLQLSRSTLQMVLAALLLALLFGLIGGVIQTKIDDLRYGRPRTDTLSAYVGHERIDGTPTQLMAINLNRQVLVLEFPGGDPAQVRTIVGPYLFGKGEDLTPVTLDARDLNGDQRPELLVTVKNEVLVYINDPDGFRTMTGDEHRQLADQLAH